MNIPSSKIAQRTLSLGVVTTIVGGLLAGCTQQTPPPQATPTAAVATPAAGVVTPAASPAASPAVAASPIVAASPVAAASPSPVAAAPRGSGNVEVAALYVREQNNKATGGSSRVRIAVEPKTNASAESVFFGEEEVGGSGAQWRASGWMAVVMSGFLLGMDPSQSRFTYGVGGNIDGPSAGALMTIATMAALLGHPVRNDAAMTGTINPDGTIGPVGGIPHKVEGAAAENKKLVLIPAGQRRSLDLNTNQPVDVVELGRSKGVDVREVVDVYEAYQLMTGQPLPKPDGLKEVRPELPSSAYNRVQSKAKEWHSRFLENQQQYNSLPSGARVEFTESLMDDAAETASKADSFYNQGLATVAYWEAFNAALTSAVAQRTGRVIDAIQVGNGSLDPAISYFRSLQTVRNRIDALADRLQTQNAATLSDVVAISEAYGYLDLALGLTDRADAELEARFQQAESDEEIAGLMGELAVWYTIADHLVELAKDSIDLGVGFGTSQAPSKERVESLAELYRRAAEANLNYFENTVVSEIASGAGVHPDRVKLVLLSNDDDYLFALSTLRAMSKLKDRAGGSINGSYAVLGGALNAYVWSSLLVAKYYSLDAIVDENLQITGVTNDRAMTNMIDFAEKRAAEYIGLAQSANGDVIQPVLNYDNAKAARDKGTTQDRLNALANYWLSSLQSQMIGILSGRANVLR